MFRWYPEMKKAPGKVEKNMNNVTKQRMVAIFNYWHNAHELTATDEEYNKEYGMFDGENYGEYATRIFEKIANKLDEEGVLPKGE